MNNPNPIQSGPQARSETGVHDISGALTTALNILDAWNATPVQQQSILGVSRRTWFGWRKQPPAQVDADKLERVSYILGIWKALRQLFPTDKGYERWPALPNTAPLFIGATPMQVMAAGHVADLYRVRVWLDGWRG